MSADFVLLAEQRSNDKELKDEFEVCVGKEKETNLRGKVLWTGSLHEQPKSMIHARLHVSGQVPPTPRGNGPIGGPHKDAGGRKSQVILVWKGGRVVYAYLTWKRINT